MLPVRDPVLKPVAIASLHPTQITVGMREVETKRLRWREKDDAKRGEFLGKHLVPVVLGPGKIDHVIDHHHLVRALLEEGVINVAVTVVANLSKLEPDAFWFVLDNRNWMHPFDDQGVRKDHTHIPQTVAALIDDPFRSLAGELRRAGGFAKDITPFSEFLWSDFLRRRLDRKAVEAKFDAILQQAIQLAKSHDASYLPGWCGPADEE